MSKLLQTRSIFKRESHTGLRAFFLIVISITLMVLDKRSDQFASIRAALSLPVAPIQHIVSWPMHFIDTVKSMLTSHEMLIAENVQLKTDQLLLRAQLQRLLAIESENNYLKALLQSAQRTTAKTMIAEVLAIDTEPFINQIVINKGSKNGIYVNQPVLDAYGVMGQVIQAGPITSRILLINDPHSGVAVQNGRNGMRALAVGSYSDGLRLLYVPKTADVKPGDIYITSGLGDHYPEGYPVGKVVAVQNDPAHQFARVTLQPSAQLNMSRQVLLVWYRNG